MHRWPAAGMDKQNECLIEALTVLSVLSGFLSARMMMMMMMKSISVLEPLTNGSNLLGFLFSDGKVGNEESKGEIVVVYGSRLRECASYNPTYTLHGGFALATHEWARMEASHPRQSLKQRFFGHSKSVGNSAQQLVQNAPNPVAVVGGAGRQDERREEQDDHGRTHGNSWLMGWLLESGKQELSGRQTLRQNMFVPLLSKAITP
ncbi:hypothetical protein C8J57DRAFT_1221375 [Mycena rebaudengoi]|nr:hypothetical protein C8J57DRAFT_1221375 [Mycena rebaudengoi]